MKNRLLPILINLIALTAIVSCIVLLHMPQAKIDTVKLNALRANVESSKQDYTKTDSLNLNIIVIGLDGVVNYSTNQTTSKSYDEWLNYAHQNDLVILEYSQGRILVYKPKQTAVNTTIIVIATFSIVTIALLILYWLYMKKIVLTPFKKLKAFAADVSIGNLDSPMLMDKHNAFGAFTESFDIMREELKKAKEKEIALEKSKKELVASLSHDIKTPIASIKAVSEVLLLNETDGKKQKNLEIIRRKANEIDELITDMFNVALQDLSELKVEPSLLSSKEIQALIAEFDYFGLVGNATIPECLILADRLRLGQIIGNIIGNSYKYANTEIVVTAAISEQSLGIEFRDFGNGVAEEELPLIAGKFYRGKNSIGLGGAGLGLYISSAILKKMGGTIDYYNTENGFAVKIWLALC